MSDSCAILLINLRKRQFIPEQQEKEELLEGQAVVLELQISSSCTHPDFFIYSKVMLLRKGRNNKTTFLFQKCEMTKLSKNK